MLTLPDLRFLQTCDPGTLLISASLRYEGALENSLRTIGLDPRQYLILKLIERLSKARPMALQVDVLNFSGMKKTTLSGHLKKMIDLEWIEKEQHEEDARHWVLSLEPKGEKILQKGFEIEDHLDHLIHRPEEFREDCSRMISQLKNL